MSMKPSLPEYGTDATGADTYATVINGITRECHNLSAVCDTQDAIISLDGGTTDHLFVDASQGQLVFQGLVIPKAAVIQGKNASAGNNYANLRITVW